jgi:ferrous iron transport protein B
MRFALVGQPNCGKSTLFNQVAGYRAETGNFSGTTITYTSSKVRVLGEIVEVVDLPGTYALAGTNPAEREVLCYLLSNPVDVIINVLDASHLSQGLNLTLELLELGLPVVVAANMMDEAARLGITLDGVKLQVILGVDVLPLIASKGRGVRNLFKTALEAAASGKVPIRAQYSLDIETEIHRLAENLDGQSATIGPDSMAIKLLEGETTLFRRIEKQVPEINTLIQDSRNEIETKRGRPAIFALSAERHGLAAQYAKQVVHQGERRVSKRDQLDRIFLHPFWGYVALVAILWVFFQSVYHFGSIFEGPILAYADDLTRLLVAHIGQGTLLAEILTGVMQGISGGVAIVLPYLLPFLFGLGFLEDIGYLPRLAFMMDALMNRMGLHGKAIVPFILGYGCNVPAVMSTRLMEDRRDRFLAATLATLVPCAARLAVVFGLVAFYLGPQIALLIYLFNLLVIAATGRFLSHILPESAPGLILEMPVYRLPVLKTVLHKMWFRAREFIVEAWPLLIAGSVVLALFSWLELDHVINLISRPLTWLLGLPSEVGVPLMFGILRKELSLVMLRQALHVADFATALSPVQMISFTVFVVFYVPCLATLAALKRELGGRAMLAIALLTVLIAVGAALIARGVAMLFL